MVALNAERRTSHSFNSQSVAGECYKWAKVVKFAGLKPGVNVNRRHPTFHNLPFRENLR